MTKQHTTPDLPARPSIKQGAAYHGVDEKFIRRRIADGSLKAYRVGKRLIRLDRDSLVALARPIGGAA
jgi:excisionase family DNA binding protein